MAENGTKSTAGNGSPYRAKVRMYRQGLGDCFLLTLPGKTRPFHMLVDFGVILGGEQFDEVWSRVFANIHEVTGGHLDVVVGTHEHWDHLSGFLATEKDFEKMMHVDQVWLAWTEDPDNSLARRLRKEREDLGMGVRYAHARLGLAGFNDREDVEHAGRHRQGENEDERSDAGINSATRIRGLMEFMGAASDRTTSHALEILRGLADTNRGVAYLSPEQPPLSPDDVNATFFVMGPPTEEKLIRKCRPSKGEGYSMQAHLAFLYGLIPGLEGGEKKGPFLTEYQLPKFVTEQHPFFQEHYWAGEDVPVEVDPNWRRIDGAWIDNAVDMALHLDSATNNTSLVLAVEIPGKEEGDETDVLLFTGDAQVGSWRSWKDLSWDVEGRKVTGEELLKKTICYKVGHHGSHNATIKENGLELMDRLQYAFLPVVRATSHRRHWYNMPLPALEKRLEDLTGDRVIAMDKSAPGNAGGAVEEHELYFELTL